MRHWKHNSCKNRLTNWSLNLNQIKHNFWLFKIHCNRIKRQIIAYKKILANDVSNVGSLPGMYKEISKFNKNKATNPIKNDPDFKRHFTKDICLATMQWKMFKLLVTREMPTEVQQQHHILLTD